MHSEKPRKKKIHKHENTYTGDILKRQEAIIMMTEDRYTAILDALKERKSMTVAEFTDHGSVRIYYKKRFDSSGRYG